MGQTVLAYFVSTVVIIMLATLYYLTEYYILIFETSRSTRIITFNPDAFPRFFVNRYKFVHDTLEMRGHYMGKNITEERGLKIEGMDVLLNDIKPKLLNDPKLETATLPDHVYFQQDRTVKDVNCKLIINGDENETKFASTYSVARPRKEILEHKDYINFTANCTTFKDRRGYIMSSLTKLEADFPIAYSLLMFKDLQQAELLLRAIYRPQNIYCIHVDNKSDDEIFTVMTKISDCFENVFMAPRRINVKWGTFTVLEPEIMCMEELLKRHKKWKYFINLTGQEFPLRTNYELVRILMTYNGANDIEAITKRANKNRWSKLPPPPHNLTATKGSVHIAANRDYVEFAIHNKKGKDFSAWVKNTGVPDECFFTTLNHNPSLRIRGAYLGHPETDNSDIKPYLARFKNWGDGVHNWPCYGKRVRMVCVFGVGDLPLISTRRELFANKFYWDYERYARDCLEELHYNRTRDEYLGKMSFDTRYYAELGFVKNKVD